MSSILKGLVAEGVKIPILGGAQNIMAPFMGLAHVERGPVVLVARMRFFIEEPSSLVVLLLYNL